MEIDSKTRILISDYLTDLLGYSDENMSLYIVNLCKKVKNDIELEKKLIEFGLNENKEKNKIFQNFKMSLVRNFNIPYLNDLKSNFVKNNLMEKTKNESFDSKKYEFVNMNTVNTEKEILLNQKYSNSKEIDSHNKNSNSNLMKNKVESNENSTKLINEFKNEFEFDEKFDKILKEKEALEKELLRKDKIEKIENNEKVENVKNNHLELSKDLIDEMRDNSKYSFIRKKLEKQIRIFKEKIESEKRLFSNVNLSLQERKMNELNIKLLKLLNEKLSSNQDNTKDHYLLPSQYDEMNIKNERKKIRKEENETNEWENIQKDRMKFLYGAENKLEINKILNKVSKINMDYDLILENPTSSNFVKGNKIEGIKDKIESARNEIILETGKNKSEITKEEIILKIREIDEMNLKGKIPIKSEMQIKREFLPIYKYKNQLIQAIKDFQVLVIVGETGSGKTTQIPQYLNEMGYSKIGKIGITQPRRVAATSVAARVANEMNCELGKEVGYSIRFEECSSRETIIKYMTDGMLLREIMNEPDLNSYSVIIIDEAHERTIHTDIILSLIKDIGKYRKDLKILISSATINADLFSNYFGNCPIFNIPGRTFDVEVFYSKLPESNYIEAAVLTILQIHMSQPKGDILVFLTGQEEIEAAVEILKVKSQCIDLKKNDLIILPIYSNLPSEQQGKIFMQTPNNCRKVVIATNIAETSITIDNIVYVIDSGFVKQNTFSSRTGIESLIVTPISKASANQRAGRAGRTQPGKCYRLYTQKVYDEELMSDNVAEIKRVNLISIVLFLFSLGVDDILNFDFITKPPEENFIKAIEQLFSIGAINKDGKLTKTGEKIVEFPLHPFMAKMIISSFKYECLEHIIVIASILSLGGSLFYSDRNNIVKDNIVRSFYKSGGDQITYLNVFKEYLENDESGIWCKENYIHHKSMIKAKRIQNQLLRICEKIGMKLPVEKVDLSSDSSFVNENIRKSICAGYFYNVAKKDINSTYRPLSNHNLSIKIHPSSSLMKECPEYVVYDELIYTTTEYMRNVIEIKYEWLIEVAPHYFKQIGI